MRITFCGTLCANQKVWNGETTLIKQIIKLQMTKYHNLLNLIISLAVNINVFTSCGSKLSAITVM